MLKKLTLFCLFFNLLTGAAWSANRTALIIGNFSYSVKPLINPENDAKDMAGKLDDLGFDVIHRENVTLKEFRQTLNEFSEKLRDRKGVAFFYFAGHAFQIEGKNFLAPVNVRVENLKTTSLSLDTVIGSMSEAGVLLNVLVLDACRNNPYTYAAQNGRGLEGQARKIEVVPTRVGLAPANANGPSDTLIAYSTGPGEIASDGTGRNGTYTKHLLDNIGEKGLTVAEVFMKVRAGVKEETRNKQVPWERSSLTKQFYFTERPKLKKPVRGNAFTF